MPMQRQHQHAEEDAKEDAEQIEINEPSISIGAVLLEHIPLAVRCTSARRQKRARKGCKRGEARRGEKQDGVSPEFESWWY